MELDIYGILNIKCANQKDTTVDKILNGMGSCVNVKQAIMLLTTDVLAVLLELSLMENHALKSITIMVEAHVQEAIKSLF